MKLIFKHIEKIEIVLWVWRMRNLTIEEKVLVFKIVHISLITTVSQSTIDQLNKELDMERKNPNMKH